LFANYSRSYQAPDIDRFFSTTYPPPTFTPVTSFNGFIDPAKATNYNLGFNYISTRNKFKITAYYIDLKDEIYYYNHNGIRKNTNIDKSHKLGFDLYDKFVVNEKFNMILNYNYIQAIIDDEEESGDDYSDNKLPGVSDHNIKATINYMPNRYATISLTQVYRSEAYAANDFSNDFDQKQDAYRSTDISATYAKDNWEVFGKINNLFNQKNGLWIRDDVVYPVNFTTTALVGLKLKY
jgi:iron complex outermembrane receptor protein